MTKRIRLDLPFDIMASTGTGIRPSINVMLSTYSVINRNVCAKCGHMLLDVCKQNPYAENKDHKTLLVIT